MQNATIQFLGAAGTVTGSKHLLEINGKRLLLDAGIFQGEKALRERNWAKLPIDPASIDAVVLSHAHIDHTGYLPRLVKDGFRGPVICTPGTRDLSAILLPDSGRIQEEEAELANRKGYSKHAPALPLYGEEDADRSLKLFETVPYGRARRLDGAVDVTFQPAGHILGSSAIRIAHGAFSVVFSGDLGRYTMPVLRDPEAFGGAEVLLVECTYGDKTHADHDPRASLARLVREVVAKRGVLLIPAFAVGRTQDLLFHLRLAQLNGDIPTQIPIFVDSPMACDTTPLYLLHREDHDDEMVRLLREGKKPLQPSDVEFVQSVAGSKAINERHGPMIIISPSGMATGGRILHHLKRRAPDPSTVILFVGYQARGSRGARLLRGERTLRIHGQEIDVRATISQISGFSAHADHEEIDRWLTDAPPPRHTFCVHGEPNGLEAMRDRFVQRGWPNVVVPSYGEVFAV